jgi:hypothetical protein
MREGIGRNVPAGLFLEAVVSDRCRGGKAFIDVSLLQNAALICAVAPDPREAVGLKFEPDGESVRL